VHDVPCATNEATARLLLEAEARRMAIRA